MTEELKPCKEEPIKELPLKGYYGGKPTRFVIKYNDHSSHSIGNADGSVDLIVANLTKRECNEVAMVEAMAQALNDSKEMENQGFSYNEKLAKICFNAIKPYLLPQKPRPVEDALRERVKRLEEALRSIAKNTCCDRCQEAALIAKKALEENHG